MKSKPVEHPITGVWEMLPEAGSKSTSILNAERIERVIEKKRKELEALYEEQSQLADVAGRRIYDVFGLDAGRVLLNSGTHMWLVERILDTAKAEGQISERRRSALPNNLNMNTHNYDTVKLNAMGYGDDGSSSVALTEAEVAAIAEAVGGTVEEIETARID